MQVLIKEYDIIQAIKIIFYLLTAIHFLLSFIFFVIRYKERMRYLRQHRLTKLRGFLSEVFHFFVIFSICMIVGSFLLIQSAISFFKLIRSFRSIKSGFEANEKINNKKPVKK
jgi:hypothetical protein